MSNVDQSGASAAPTPVPAQVRRTRGCRSGPRVFVLPLIQLGQSCLRHLDLAVGPSPWLWGLRPAGLRNPSTLCLQRPVPALGGHLLHLAHLLGAWQWAPPVLASLGREDGDPLEERIFVQAGQHVDTVQVQKVRPSRYRGKWFMQASHARISGSSYGYPHCPIFPSLVPIMSGSAMSASKTGGL